MKTDSFDEMFRVAKSDHAESEKRITDANTLIRQGSEEDLFNRILGTKLTSGDFAFDVHHAPEVEKGEYKCPKCKDRYGWTEVIEGRRTFVPCDCRDKVKFEARLRKAKIPYEYWNITLPISDRVETFAHVDIENDEVTQIDINRFLEQYTDKLDEHIAQRDNLVLFGNNGSGKTMATMIVATHALRQERSCLYMTMKHYINNVAAMRRDEEAQYLVKQARSVDFLLIDDFGKESYDDTRGWVYSEVEDLLRHRFGMDAITILTSNFNPLEKPEPQAGDDATVATTHHNSIQSLLAANCVMLEVLIEKDYRYEIGRERWKRFDLKSMEV